MYITNAYLILFYSYKYEEEQQMGNENEKKNSEEVAYRKASIIDMILSVGTNGGQMCFYILMMYASYIANEGYGIAVATVGVILSVTKVFDGVTDAMAAAIIELMPAKHGKVRIGIIIGFVVESLATMMLFNWAAGKFEGVAGVVIFTITYVMYTLGYTMYGTAGAVNPTIITNDPKQRPMMGFIGVAYSYLTPMIFNTMISFWILPKYDNQYNAEMLRDSCIIFVAFAAILTITTCIGIRKVDVEETYVINSETDKSQGRIKFKDMWHVLSRNRACQMYIISCATDKLAQSTATQAIIMTMLNGILIGSYKATTMINNFTMIVGIIFAFLGGLYVAKYGTKQATIVWSWVAIAVAVVTTGFCVVLGKDGMSQISVAMAPTIIYVVLMTAATAVRMILTTAAGAMRSDVVDYELERSGKYMPAVVAGVYSFIDKLMTALAAGLSAFCVAAIGYKNTMPQMGDKATTGVFLMTMVLSFGLPIVGWICNLVAMKYYPLSKERMVEVQRNIANMRK